MRQSDTGMQLPPGGFELVEPPNLLASKAGAFRAKNVDHDRLDRSLARLVRNYPEAVAEQRVALRAAWNRIKNQEALPDDLRRFGEIAHDFKGQAASFGYPLVGHVAETLSVIAKAGAVRRERLKQLVEAHVSAIEQILAARIEGDGGAHGKAIVEGLREATRKARETA